MRQPWQNFSVLSGDAASSSAMSGSDSVGYGLLLWIGKLEMCGCNCKVFVFYKCASNVIIIHFQYTDSELFCDINIV